jgi:hypothetical protein
VSVFRQLVGLRSPPDGRFAADGTLFTARLLAFPKMTQSPLENLRDAALQQVIISANYL